MPTTVKIKNGKSHTLKAGEQLKIQTRAGETYEVLSESDKIKSVLKKRIQRNDLIVENTEDKSTIEFLNYVDNCGSTDTGCRVLIDSASASIGAPSSSSFDWGTAGLIALGLGAVGAAAGGGGGGDDDGGNSSTGNTIIADTLAPTIAIRANTTNLKANGTANITFTLSEASSNFTATDVAVTGGTLSNFSGSGKNYTATLTANAGVKTAKVSVENVSFTDAAGNANVDGADANNSLIFTVALPDTTAPSIAISAGNTNLGVNSITTIVFTLSEVSTDFTASDVTVVGGVLSNFNGSGTSYTATFTPAVGVKSASVSVLNNAFSDAATNFNVDGADANNTVSFTVSSELAPQITNTTFDFTKIENLTTSDIVFQASGNQVTSWSLQGSDAHLFAIDAAGTVRFKDSPNFEAPSDANKDGVYHLTLNALNSKGIVADTKDFIVRVSDVSEIPSWLNSTTYGTKNTGVKSLLYSDGDASSWNSSGVSFTTVGKPVALTYAFQNAGALFENDIGDTVRVDDAFSLVEKDFIRSVFSHFSSVANITYTENNSQKLYGADIRLFAGTYANLETDPSTLGFAFQPSSQAGVRQDYEGNFVFVTDSVGLKGSISTPFSTPYGDEKNTVSHELAHTMGLDHPFNNAVSGSGFDNYYSTTNIYPNRNGLSTGGGHDSPLTDTQLETIMTYHNSNKAPNSDVALGIYTQTNTPWQLGIYDIAALQHLYGVNYKTNAGDTEYTFNQKTPSYLTIWDGGGNDTITHIGDNSALINLNEGARSHVGTTPGWMLHDTDWTKTITAVDVTTDSNGTATIDADGYGYVFTANMAAGGYNGTYEVVLTFSDNTTEVLNYDQIAPAVTEESQYNLGIAFGVTIENAVGGNANDIIIGNLAANHIKGGAGNDTMTGGAGGDWFIFDGIFGTDTITDFTKGQDTLQLSNAMSGAVDFSAGLLNVAGFGSIHLSGVMDMVAGTDYVFV